MATFRKWMDRVLRTICITLFGALVTLVVWQVFSRQVLNQPSAWTEEAARYTFVWATMIGISIAVGEKADVVMDFLVERLPRLGQRILDLLAYTAVGVFVVYVMIWGGFRQSSGVWNQTNPLLPFTQGQLYLAIPISGCLLAVYLTLHIITVLSSSYEKRQGFNDEVEADVV